MKIKRILTFFDEIREASGRAAEPVLRKSAAVAIVQNPFAGKYVEDLSLLTKESEAVGREICAIAVSLLAPHKPVSYGKAAIVGIAGEQEHGNALLSTTFAEPVRAALGGGKAWMASMTKVAAPGAHIDVPLACKDALYVRSHYDGMTLMLPGAPMPDEIALILCLANRGRLNARVGGLRFEQLKGENGLV